jgi:hypothetical protein
MAPAAIAKVADAATAPISSLRKWILPLEVNTGVQARTDRIEHRSRRKFRRVVESRAVRAS